MSARIKGFCEIAAKFIDNSTETRISLLSAAFADNLVVKEQLKGLRKKASLEKINKKYLANHIYYSKEQVKNGLRTACPCVIAMKHFKAKQVTKPVQRAQFRESPLSPKAAFKTSKETRATSQATMTSDYVEAPKSFPQAPIESVEKSWTHDPTQFSGTPYEMCAGGPSSEYLEGPESLSLLPSESLSLFSMDLVEEGESYATLLPGAPYEMPAGEPSSEYLEVPESLSLLPIGYSEESWTHDPSLLSVDVSGKASVDNQQTIISHKRPLPVLAESISRTSRMKVQDSSQSTAASPERTLHETHSKQHSSWASKNA